jgi:hypothetical protein|tara:strand:+ start:217 stop:507 length:291 start_codon:yes stop_codon:yes gene_type:complete
MFKQSIILHSSDDAKKEIDVFSNLVRNSGLQPHIEQFLDEQVKTTLRQFEKQLTHSPLQKVVADRVFEGDGYKVIVRVRYGSDSIISKLKRVIGLE